MISKLRLALKPYHPYFRGTPKRLSFFDHPASLETIRNLYLQTDLGALDLISEVSGIGNFEIVNKSSQTLSLFERPCKVLTLEALIRSKETLSREKDLPVIKELKVLLQESKLKQS